MCLQELFQQVDRLAKGKIALESLEDIITTAVHRDKENIEYGLSELKAVLKLVSISLKFLSLVSHSFSDVENTLAPWYITILRSHTTKFSFLSKWDLCTHVLDVQ